MGGYSNRKRRLKLWFINPVCYYCGKTTMLIPESKRLRNGLPVPTMATLEHICGVSDIRRMFLGYNPQVISCWKCNNDKAVTDNILSNYPSHAGMELKIINFLKREKNMEKYLVKK